MAKRKQKKNKEERKPFLSDKIKRNLIGVVFLLLSIITALSFFDGLAGRGGEIIYEIFFSLFGNTVFIIPFLFLFSALVYFRTRYENFLLPLLLSNIFLITGVSTLIATSVKNNGGFWGRVLGFPFVDFLGFAAYIIFLTLITAGVMIFLHLLHKEFSFFDILKGIFKKKDEAELSRVRKVFISSNNERKEKEEKKEEEKKEVSPPKSRDLPSLIPPLDILKAADEKADPGDIKRNASIIKKTFSDFDIAVGMNEVNVGPSVTQYTLKPAEGVKLSRITSLSDDLAISLAMHPVRTEAPIPGKSLVGIEVPNRKRAQITLGGLLKDKTFFQSDSVLTVVIGKAVSGEALYTDLSKMPHLLVAGSTGSGKTIFLNTLILSLIYKNSPEDLRLIMVDPKRVEFSLYANLPHLLTPVIYDAEKTSNALGWVIGEMERRFKVLSEVGSRNIASYQDVCLKKPELEKMPYIVFIVDELADLMATKGNEIEGGIVRIAQMARAVGIHLVLATQRPSVEVITGLIKANITSRVSFRVASQVDSRTILDMAGAEKLLGSGDMLCVSTENSKPRRIQAPYISEKEAKDVVSWLKENVEMTDDDQLAENLGESLEKKQQENTIDSDEDDDVLYEDAKKLVVESGKASASLLQRRLRVGYARAARLLDILEMRGVVGPAEGAKPREIYETPIREDDNPEEDSWTKV